MKAYQAVMASMFVLLSLTGCGESVHVLSYEELERFPKSCEKRVQQVQYLQKIQQIKNFAEDPDQLSDYDRAYNSKLKSTIWWYTIRCGNEKATVTANSN